MSAPPVNNDSALAVIGPTRPGSNTPQLKVNVANRTLLPAPVAKLVSLATATSSLSLRVGGFFSNAAINGVKVGALSGFELTRVILEGILSRAGQDVVDTSAGTMGRAVAENLLEKSLAALHASITQTSFLLSAGFQVGTTSINSSLTLGNYVLSALDAILGDTETSRALATILLLIQREFHNAQVGTNGEKAGLGDAFVGLIGFILLQRWGRERTEREFLEKGGASTIWDLVVLKQPGRVVSTSKQPIPRANAQQTNTERRRTPMLPRRTSFVSARGDQEFEAYANEDGVSFISNVSSRPVSGHLDESTTDQAFRQQLLQQIGPGAHVRIKAKTTLINSVTVEVYGDSEAAIEPPRGYALVATENANASAGEPRRLVFQSTKKRQRTGSFTIDPQTSSQSEDELSSPDGEDGGLFLARPIDSIPDTMQKGASNGDSSKFDPHPTNLPTVSSEPILANQKRARTPQTSSNETVLPTELVFESPQPIPFEPIKQKSPKHKKQSLRNTLKRGTSYKNLVDFWRDRDRFPKIGPPILASLQAGEAPFHQSSAFIPDRSRPTPMTPMTPMPAREHGSNHNAPFSLDRSRSMTLTPLTPLATGDSEGHTNSYFQDRPKQPSSPERQFTDRFEGKGGFGRGGSRHHRSTSSIYTMATTSETSLVLHDGPERDDSSRIVSALHQTGMLPEIYPRQFFVQNLARFSRFSTASYGSSFLRFASAVLDHDSPESVKETLKASPSDLEQHRSFASYLKLPSSTVLLSSYIDPQGGTNASGETDTGMPLVNYISIDHASKAVVLTCRGTLGFEDVLTDMICDYEEIKWHGRVYPVHKGMLASARRLLTLYDGRVVATLKAALEEFEDYGLVFCGHSAGGDVAALLGILLAQANTSSTGGASAFVTSATPVPQLIQEASISINPPSDQNGPQAANKHLSLPPNRPIHVYAYGPAALVSRSMQLATRGLITTVIHGQDFFAAFCLGTVPDFQAVALAFKTDTKDAKGEVRRRVWEGLMKAFRDKTGLAALSGTFHHAWLTGGDEEEDDQWPWAALKSLRAAMTAEKLVPPGDVYTITSQPVLQRHAFVDADQGDQDDNESAKSYKPATRVTLRHVRDVDELFREIRFGATMIADHLPVRYEQVLALLEKGVCG